MLLLQMDGADDPESGPTSPHIKAFSRGNKLLDAGQVTEEESSLRPLKKARFVWQVKGNYHLKNTSDTEMGNPESTESEAGSSTAPVAMHCNTDSPSVPKSQKGTGQSLVVCDHHPPSSLSESTSSTRTNNDPYPPLPPLRIDATSVSCVVCDTFNIRKASLNTDGEQSSHTPPLPTLHPDWNVRKWQTRQIAKAFMDNTINCVLEDLGFTPLSESAPDSDPGDVLASIYFPGVTHDADEDDDDDEGIENEGILSAIQRHGLQRHRLETHRPRYSRRSPISCSPSPPRTRGSNQQLTYGNLGQEEDASPSSPESLSVGSDIEIAGETLSPADIEADETDPSDDNGSDVDVDTSNDNYVAPSSCRCAYLCPSKNSEDARTGLLSPSVPSSADSTTSSGSSDDEEESECTKFGGEYDSSSSNSSTKFSSKSVDQEDEGCKKRQGKAMVFTAVSKRRCVERTDDESKSSSTSSAELSLSPVLDNGLMSITSNCDINSPTFGHFEFMDAAVAAAIQKKGLSALACQDI